MFCADAVLFTAETIAITIAKIAADAAVSLFEEDCFFIKLSVL